MPRPLSAAARTKMLDAAQSIIVAEGLDACTVDEVSRLAQTISAYLHEAIAVELAGIEVEPPPELVLVDELRQRLDQDPALEAAFESLTPGRRREYNLYFSDAKRSETRVARIEKHAGRILYGRGLRDG